MNPPTLWEAVGSSATLWQSPLHGEQHANRVAATGLELATRTPGADAAVVFAFGLLHDAQRTTDAADPQHGGRAADLAQRLHDDGLLQLTSDQLSTLLPPLRYHDRPIVSNDPTAGCCLDADRLNLQRLHIVVRADLLSTETAPTLIDWAAEQLDSFVPWETLAAQARRGT